MLSDMNWFLLFIQLIFFSICLSYSLMSVRLWSVLLSVLSSFQLELKLKHVIWHVHSVYASCCVCFSWESCTHDWLIKMCLMMCLFCIYFMLCMLHVRILFPWPAHSNPSWNWDASDDCAARYIVCVRK